MKILVTGANGFIGQNLVKVLLDKNYEVHCIVRVDSNTSNISQNITIFKYDQNIDGLIEYFNEQKFDGLIHLASLFLATHTKNDISNLISSNIKFGTELLEACKISDVKWFINTGTFWQNYENEDYNPVNLYASTKEAFENIAKYYTETSNLIFTNIKLNDTFGANDTRNKVFNLWNKIAKSGETLEMSAGEQIIDISYIDDVVLAYEVLITHLSSDQKEELKNKEFVVTNNEKYSLKELSKLFEEATNTKLSIKWGARPYREREVMIPYNNGEIVPNWKQKYTLKEAIKKTIGEN
ncbi:NAD(P)-dependent oxidoreductase [Aliarcobacter cryaerophilus]|uniref:NAD-dependent epimerase/dehydratase family protein n=1 Tax=Aliarcobacter cryaerophilus TaxID=28198 RepID=UPI0021B6BD09|nr:NAD(P)-dependent oxidoreductase [Aliarcobacter cryaerophilus]MCT7539718.1 NAD(P)-dependent oxidoreductase [Aliarcobacter cryaerophilus]